MEHGSDYVQLVSDQNRPLFIYKTSREPTPPLKCAINTLNIILTYCQSAYCHTKVKNIFQSIIIQVNVIYCSIYCTLSINLVGPMMCDAPAEIEISFFFGRYFRTIYSMLETHMHMNIINIVELLKEREENLDLKLFTNYI